MIMKYSNKEKLPLLSYKKVESPKFGIKLASSVYTEIIG